MKRYQTILLLLVSVLFTACASVSVTTSPKTSPSFSKPYQIIQFPNESQSVSCGPPEGWIEYRIKVGDTPTWLAASNDISVTELMTSNCINEKAAFQIGDIIYLPSKSSNLAMYFPDANQSSGVFQTDKLNEFDKCVATTNLVFTSYPSKCLSGGKFIINPMTSDYSVEGEK